MLKIEISKEPIELYKLLKLANLFNNGSEAKAAIAEGLVLVNGDVETKKRKKITANDIVEFEGHKLKAIVNL